VDESIGLKAESVPIAASQNLWRGSCSKVTLCHQSKFKAARMANGLSITADNNRARVFQCPVCKQTIDMLSDRCRFCSATIDTAAAEAAADLMAKVNRACNDASYLKITMVCGVVFLGLMFLPVVGGLGALGYLFLKFAIPVWVILWFVRFGKIKADDADFHRARKFMLILGIPVTVLLIGDAAYTVSRWVMMAIR
jgi:hypothetical protein